MTSRRVAGFGWRSASTDPSGNHAMLLSQPCDRPLELKCDPEVGAHILTPRRGYTHHGIYVGSGKVVQYGGLSRGLWRGPVEEVSLSQFAHGRQIWVRAQQPRWSDPHEVVRRARSRLGEDRYNVLTNNCEHFCEWCVRGEHRSYQVDALINRCLRLLPSPRSGPRRHWSARVS